MLPRDTGYFHRRPNPTIAGYHSINRTHDSEDFFDKLQLEANQSNPRQRCRQQMLLNRETKLMSDASQKQFRMTRLQKTIQKLRCSNQENSRRKWVSPMAQHNKFTSPLTEANSMRQQE